MSITCASCCESSLFLPLLSYCPGNLKAEIEAANVNFMRCFDGGDFDGLSMLYTVDCKLMPTGSATLIGREGRWCCADRAN